MRNLVLSITSLLFSLVVSAEVSQLEIKFTNIPEPSGTLLIAIFDRPEYWLSSDKDKPPVRDARHVVTATGEASVIVEGLPAGTYAVSVFQDMNEDEELDTNFIGFPKEPFGFSAPMGKFGPPAFKDASIIIDKGRYQIEVIMN